MRKKDDPDLELVRQCQDPDSDRFEEAFAALYEKYKDRVYNVAWRITGNSAEAFDVIQETFVVLLRKIADFKFEAKFSSWLYRIVVNNSIDSKRSLDSRTRREGPLPVRSDGNGSMEVEDGSSREPGDRLERSEREERLHRGLQQISHKLRTALILRYLEGLPYEEISQVLQVSLGTVKSRLARGHIALARVLGSQFGEEDKYF